MKKFSFGIRAIAIIVLATCVAGSVEAQIYGTGSGGYYSGLYGGTYVPGAPVAGGYSVSPSGYTSGYGSYGLPYPGSLGYPYGTAYTAANGNAFYTGNAFSSGNTVSTYNAPGTAYYGVGNLGYGASYGQTSYGYTSPIVANPNPAYSTSTAIIRSGPTGGVMQYNAKGNGYTYIPDSTYPTLVLTQPTLGLSRTYVPPAQTPVVIESRPAGSPTINSPGSTGPQLSGSAGNYGMIKISLPRSATGTLTYSLNGHFYTIQPGYSQTFRDDRPWTIEFKRDATAVDTIRYPIKTGQYTFLYGATGWDLLPADGIARTALPPLPAGTTPTPLPEYKPTPSPPSPSIAPPQAPAPTPQPPP